METTTQTRGPDRRRQPRGGRRGEDREGFSPLVLLVGRQSDVSQQSEAILAKLKFAVSTVESVEEALRVIPDLRPDLIVAGEFDGQRIRGAVQSQVRIVVMHPPSVESAEMLTDKILRTVRTSPALN